MKYTNILEKLLCLFNIIIKSPFDIAFILIVVISLILFFSKKISRKVCFSINVLASLILILLVIFNNIDFLGSTYNSVVDYTFTNIYFPSVYVYLFVLLVMNIFSIGSLINNKIDDRYKKVNKIGLLVINFIFALVLECVALNKVDLFKKESLFANSNLVILLELSVMVFIGWVLANGIIYLSSIITRRVINTRGNRELVRNEVNMNAVSSTINEAKILDEYNDKEEFIGVKNKFIPEKFSNIGDNVKEEKNEFVQNKFVPNVNLINNNIQENSFDLSALIPPIREVTPINSNIVVNNVTEEVNSASTLNDLFSSIIGEQQVVVVEEKNENDNYTLNDYRVFNKMLKDIREHNNSSRIVIDKNLEYRLITKYSTEAYAMFKRMLKSYSN